jgi:hypothetical protein
MPSGFYAIGFTVVVPPDLDLGEEAEYAEHWERRSDTK